MRFKKVLLTHLYYKESGYGDALNFPPAGLGYLGQYLEKENIMYDVIDTGTGYTHEDVLDRISIFRPDLAAFSLTSICYPKSFELIRRIKEIHPDMTIVVGGAHVSTRKTAILAQNEAIDFAIEKEGEIPLSLLCKGELPERIPGLMWRGKGGKINSNAPQLADISQFPYPKYECFDLLNRYKSGSISIVTSRGCPFKCAFCQQSSLLGKKWRGREAQDVVDEIEYWYNRGFLSIHILDDNFGLDRARFFRIAELLAKKKMNNLKLFLIGGLRIQNMTEDVLVALKKMGVSNLSFGVESGSDKILKFIEKGITVKDVDRVVKIAVDMEFLVRLFFIIGFPYEKMEDVKKTFELALRHRVYEVRFFNLVPYEETKIMSWIEENDAKLLYPYEEYMSNFKRFQRIPIVAAKEGMTLEEKKEALRMADEVVGQVEARRSVV